MKISQLIHLRFAIITYAILSGTIIFGQQTIYDTINHDGLQRSFILYIPDTYTPTEPTPLVINFHGYTSNAFEQMNYGDFREIADTAGFILVHPMGTLDGAGNTYWNANWGGEVDDIGFTGALIDSLGAEYNINTDRVFSTGMSNGGFMSYTLACELSNRIAAIASVTGTMNSNQTGSCSPQHPLPVMEIHGTADFVVPYNGNIFMESIPEVLSYWVDFNNCDPEPTITEMPDLDPNDGCTAEKHFYGNGSNGVEVVHFKIINGGHTWPGTEYSTGSGNTNQDIDASSEIWKFFSKFDINGFINPTHTIGLSKHKREITFAPNPSSGPLVIHLGSNTMGMVRITDLSGREMTRMQGSDSSPMNINLENLSPGIYILQIENALGRLVLSDKLVVI